MAVTYTLRDTASDLPGGGAFSTQLLTTTGTAGSVSFGNLAAGTSVSGHGFTEPGVPGAAGATGTITVEINVTTGVSDFTVQAAIVRVNSAGTAQGTPITASAQSASTAGVKTFTFTNANLGTWAAGDRLRVTYTAIRASGGHGNTAFSIGANTINEQVATPFTAAPNAAAAAIPLTVGLAPVTEAPAAAGINTTALTSGSNATDGTSFVTASVDPADDAVVWLHVALRHDTLEPSTPSISGCGLTWTQVAEQNAGDLYFDTSTTRTKHFVFRGHHATPSAGAITIDLGAVTHAGAVWEVIEQTGVDSPASPLVQVASARCPGGTTLQTGGSATFGAALAAEGAALVFLANFDNAAGAVTPEAGYSQVAFEGPLAGESNMSVGSYWDQQGADTTPSLTWTTSALWGLLAVEVAPTAVVLGEAQTSIPLTLAMAPVADAPAGPIGGGYTFVGLQAEFVDNTQATITLAVPAGVAAGTVMLAFIGFASAGVQTWVPPAGWTQLGTVRSANGEHSSTTWTRVAGASEPADYSWSINDNVNRKHGYIVAWDGVDPADPIDVHFEQPDGAAGGNVALAVTTTGDGKLLFAGMCQELHEVVWVNGDGMETRYAEFVDDLDDRLSVAAFDQLAGAAGLHTRTFNHDTGTLTGNSTGHLVALNPTAAAGPNEAQASIPLALAVTSAAAADHAVTTTIPLSLDVDAATAVGHEATTVVPLTLDIAPVADAPTVGVAETQTTIPLTLAVTAATAATHETATAIPLTAAVAPVTDAPIPGAPNEAQTAIPLTLAAATAAATDHTAQATIPLTAAVDAATDVDHQAAAQIPLNVAVAPVADAPTVGVAEAQTAIPLTLAMTGQTATIYQAQAPIPLELTIAPVGARTSSAAAPITLDLLLAATGGLPPPLVAFGLETRGATTIGGDRVGATAAGINVK